MKWTLFLLVYALLDTCASAGKIHDAHLPSGWYSRNPAELQREIDHYIRIAQNNFSLFSHSSTDESGKSEMRKSTLIRALIVPHAGHRFSGIAAAAAYAPLMGEHGEKMLRVVILAPSHTEHFKGVALPDYSAYRTPLGTIGVDVDAVTYLLDACEESEGGSSVARIMPRPHSAEHSIEVQLPFLQTVFSTKGNRRPFSIVPIIVGDISISMDRLINALLHLLNADEVETLFVVSSDFMHYGRSYGHVPFTTEVCDRIRLDDSEAVEAIADASLHKFETALRKTRNTVCGQNPIRLLLSMLERNKENEKRGNDKKGDINAYLTAYYNSVQINQAASSAEGFDVAQLFLCQPDKLYEGGSVSYVAMVFLQEKEERSDSKAVQKEKYLTSFENAALIRLVRRRIYRELLASQQQKSNKRRADKGLIVPILTKGLKLEDVGCFVTLKVQKNGELRGCIGQIFPNGAPLHEQVSDLALSAAFHDGRFRPVATIGEMDQLVVHISILTPPQPIRSSSEIVIGKHGIVLRKSGASSVFLPSVAVEQKWNLPTTLAQLSRKAGLPSDAWQGPGAAFHVFESVDIHELLPVVENNGGNSLMDPADAECFSYSPKRQQTKKGKGTAAKDEL